MALGNNGFTGGALIFLSPRSKDKDKKKVKPHFTVGRVVEDKIVDDKETVNNVGGDLIKLDFKEHTYNDKVIEDAVFYIRDNVAEETYRLPITFSIAGRGFFNSLAALKDSGNFKNLQIDYYETKTGYDAYALKQDGTQVKWKYALTDQPKPLEIKHPKTGEVLQRDYAELNAFFKSELVEISQKLLANKGNKQEDGDGEVSQEQNKPVVKTAVKAQPITPAKKTVAKVAAPVVDENADEEVPF